MAIRKSTLFGDEIVESFNKRGVSLYKRKNEDFGSVTVKFQECNLRCVFCFAQKYSYDISNQPKDKISNIGMGNKLYNYIENCNSKKGNRFDNDCKKCKKCNSCKEQDNCIEDIKINGNICGRHGCNGIKYIQITGGESLLNIDRIEFLVSSIIDLNNYISKNREINENIYGVIIQTNGVFIGENYSTYNELTELLSNLRDLSNIDVLFEVSLKGTNEEEFKLLSGSSHYTLKNQIDGFWILRDIAKDSNNIKVVARLGTGHHHKSVHFINKNKSMFLKEHWDEEFKKIYYMLESEYGEKMVAECINAEGDGGGGYKQINIPAIYRCVKKDLVVFKKYKPKLSKSKEAKESIESEYKIYCRYENRFNDYEEFIKYFQPMTGIAKKMKNKDEFKLNKQSPNDIYFGRNEFKRVKLY